MLLGEGEVVGTQVSCRQPVVHIAIEGEYGLLGVFRGEGQRPVGIAFEVEQGQLVGQIHQPGDVGRRQMAQLPDQGFRLLQVAGLREGADMGRRGEVQRLGGGKEDEHGRNGLEAKDCAVRHFTGW